MNNRIPQMESKLEQITEATKELQEKINELKRIKEDTKSLYSYYGSETWYADREANSVTNGDGVVKAGVLSEDLIYDSITELRDVAFDMLELGTEILKEWI